MRPLRAGCRVGAAIWGYESGGRAFFRARDLLGRRGKAGASAPPAACFVCERMDVFKVRDALDRLMFWQLRDLARTLGAEASGPRGVLSQRILAMYDEYTVKVTDAVGDAVKKYNPVVGGKRKRATKKRPTKNLAKKFEEVADGPSKYDTMFYAVESAAVFDAAVVFDAADAAAAGAGGYDETEERGPGATPVNTVAVSAPVEVTGEPIIIDGSPVMVYMPKRLRFWVSPQE